jgi:alpha-mannosidase
VVFAVSAIPIRLVRLIDRLLDILDTDPEFGRLILDGQMVVVEDYLEVRPEQRFTLVSSVRDGQGGRGIVVRCYKLTSRTVTAQLRLFRPFNRASLVDFLERDRRELEVRDGEIAVEARPKTVISIRCED